MTPGPREWKVGSTTLRFEPPDLLWMTHQGEFSMQDARDVVDIFRELGTSRPFILVGDLRQAPSGIQDVSRYISEQVKPEWFLGSIYLGARLAQKAAAKGILVVSLLEENARQEVLDSLHFVSTLEEVHALIARIRERAAR
jgi:hypothetical protein